MDAVNNLVEKDELVAWSRMKEERRGRTITKLLHTVEQSALALARNSRSSAELEVKASDMGRTPCCQFSSASSYYHQCKNVYFPTMLALKMQWLL